MATRGCDWVADSDTRMLIVTRGTVRNPLDGDQMHVPISVHHVAHMKEVMRKAVTCPMLVTNWNIWNWVR